MINENVRILSEIASEFARSGDVNDIEKNKGEILFPFIEEVLGYDTINVGDVVIAPAYTDDGTFKLDYGLRSNKPNYYKSCIKVVNRGSDFDDQIPFITRCLMSVETEFIIVTDCFEYKIWVFDETKEDLIAIGYYSLLNPEESDQSLLDLIHCPPEKKPRQEYAVREDDEDEINTTEVHLIQREPTEIPKRKVVHKEIKKKKKSKKPLIIGVIIVLLLLAVLLVGFLTKGDDGQFFSTLPVIGSQSGIDKGQLDGALTLDASSGSSINMTLYSRNIPQGGVIKFELNAGIYKDAVYGSIGADGKASASYAVPASWDEPNITVVAYLRFDEANYAQPSNVKSTFGEVGEKIIGKDGAPDKFAITYGTVAYDSEAIRNKLQYDASQRAELERQERLNALGNLNIRMDAAGNWKIVPGGYDMNKVNITELIHVYPQIFYDGSLNQPYFFLVCGTINQMQVVNFKTVTFYADGYEWAWDVNTNVYDVDVTGGIAKEWVYFSSANVADIITNSQFLASSEVARVSFVMGNKIVQYNLSNNEKANILTMIAAYDKYFNTGSVPKQEWYIEYREAKNPGSTGTGLGTGTGTGTGTGVGSGTGVGNGAGGNGGSGNGGAGSTISLNYLKQPISMWERDSDAEKELNELLVEIQNKRLRGEQITALEESQLELYVNRYKVLPDELVNAIYTEMTNAEGVLSVTPKFDELKSGYYKIYLNYSETNTSIESGYIKEIYVLPDQTVYVPIKTVINDKDFGYAVFTMSSVTYNNLLVHIATNDYETIR